VLGPQHFAPNACDLHPNPAVRIMMPGNFHLQVIVRQLLVQLMTYCVFLADGVMQRYPNYFYEIVVDEFAGVDRADLEYAVTGRYVKKVRPKPVM
jgi:hypothetical protein